MAKLSRARILIRHKAAKGVGSCLCAEMAPQCSEMDAEGMAVLLNSAKDCVFRRATGLKLDQADVETAVEGCPVNTIHIGFRSTRHSETVRAIRCGGKRASLPHTI